MVKPVRRPSSVGMSCTVLEPKVRLRKETLSRPSSVGITPLMPQLYELMLVKAVSKPMMVLVLPVPGGPCSSAHQVVSVSLQLQQNCSPLSAAVSH